MADVRIVIIGGGPAGLMAANQLEKNKIDYILLEKNNHVGAKLRITGGGRCNVTNRFGVDAFIDHLTCHHKRFIYGSLTMFGPNDVIGFFKSKGLNLTLEHHFKYFPETKKSQSVIDALTKDLDMKRIYYMQSVHEIQPTSKGFDVITQKETFHATHVVVAVGSASYPKTGSTGDGLAFAQQLDIDFSPYTPAETHIYANMAKLNLSDLQGLSLAQREIHIKQTKKRVVDDLIFTHYGLSGPGIMHLSEDIYFALQKGKTSVEIKLIDKEPSDFDLDIQSACADKVFLLKFLDHYVPKRLSKKILELCRLENIPTNQLKKTDWLQLKNLLFHFSIPIDRVEDKEKAYVNAGGITLSELDPKTMMVKKIPNLYYIGEVVNLHGPIGGYNITMALSMGVQCALGIYQQLNEKKRQ